MTITSQTMWLAIGAVRVVRRGVQQPPEEAAADGGADQERVHRHQVGARVEHGAGDDAQDVAEPLLEEA
jgi:hypothetical protein